MVQVRAVRCSVANVRSPPSSLRASAKAKVLNGLAENADTNSSTSSERASATETIEGAEVVALTRSPTEETLDASGFSVISSAPSERGSPGRIVAVESSSSSLREEEEKGSEAQPRPEATPQESAPTPSSAVPFIPQRRSKSVSFNSVDIREYPRTLGDHPDTMAGPPITLQWHYCCPANRPLDLEEYERGRAPRRTKSQLLMHPNVRRRLLRADGARFVGGAEDSSVSSSPLSASSGKGVSEEGGVTDKEMKKAEREVHRSQMQRRNTVAFYPLVQPVEDVYQSVRRKVTRRSWRSGDDRLWKSEDGEGE